MTIQERLDNWLGFSFPSSPSFVGLAISSSFYAARVATQLASHAGASTTNPEDRTWMKPSCANR